MVETVNEGVPQSATASTTVTRLVISERKVPYVHQAKVSLKGHIYTTPAVDFAVYVGTTVTVIVTCTEPYIS